MTDPAAPVPPALHDPSPGSPAPDGPPPVAPEVDERRLHPAWVLSRAIGVLRGLLPAFIALAVGLREWAVPAVALLAVVAVAGLVVVWWYTSYAVVDGTLRLRSGVFARRERAVPASRISALDTRRGIVQRAFGLVSLEVQTAGGGRHAELSLEALTTEEAERLRAALGHAAMADAGPRPTPADRPAPASDGGDRGRPVPGSPTPDREGPGDAPRPGDPVAPAWPLHPGAPTVPGLGDPAPGPPPSPSAGAAPGSPGPPPSRPADAAPGAASGTPGPPPSRSADAAPGPPGAPPATSSAASARPFPSASSPLAPPPEPVYAITARQLVVAALTGPQLGLVVVLIGSLLTQGSELLPGSVTDRVEDELSGANATAIAVFVLVGLLTAVVVSVAGTVLAFAEFAVVRDDRRLRVRRGLVTERVGTIPLDRIHGVRIVEGLLRRRLGYATVQVEVAGYRGDDELTRTLVPLVHRRDLPGLMARMLPEIPWTDGPLTRPPARARRRYWTVPLLLGLAVGIVVAGVLPGAWELLGLLPLLVALALGDARWRGAGWALGPETLAVRSQLVARTTLLVLARRAQRIEHQSQPLQRRAALASLEVALATGRRGGVRHLDAQVAGDLQRAVAARTARAASPAVPRDGSLSFAAPPE